MSIPLYQNQNTFDIAVPTYNGPSVTVLPHQYVKGSYFQALADLEILTLYTGPAPNSWEIVYTYPEIPGISAPGISEIITTAPLTGGDVTSTVTLGIEALGITTALLADGSVTADKLDLGTVLGKLNGLAGNITIEAGSNVTVTTGVDSITIAAFAEQLKGGALTLYTDPLTQLTTPTVDFNATTGGYFNVPIEFQKAVTLSALGRVTGTVLAGTVSPLIDLAVEPSTTSAIRVAGNSASGDKSFIKVTDNGITLFEVTDKGVYAKGLGLGSKVVTAGTTNVGSSDASIFAADAVAGAVTFMLPQLVNVQPGTTFIFSKIDASVNVVLVNPSNGETINGVASKTISTQWGTLRVSAVKDGSTSIWLVT